MQDLVELFQSETEVEEFICCANILKSSCFMKLKKHGCVRQGSVHIQSIIVIYSVIMICFER